MDKKKRIVIGDKVDVFFSAGEALFNCEVLDIPYETGESWHLLDKNGNLVYVQLFEMMLLKEK